MSETAFYSPAMTEIAVVTPERPAGGQSVGSITAIIDRIEEAIETETTSIKSDPAFDIRASNARPSANCTSSFARNAPKRSSNETPSSSSASLPT